MSIFDTFGKTTDCAYRKENSLRILEHAEFDDLRARRRFFRGFQADEMLALGFNDDHR